MLKKRSLGRPRICWELGAYTPSILRTTLGIERQRLYQSSRGRARQGDLQWSFGRPSDHGSTVLIGFCFETCLKTIADHFFGTRPSENWGDRTRSSFTCLHNNIVTININVCVFSANYKLNENITQPKNYTSLSGKKTDIFTFIFLFV